MKTYRKLIFFLLMIGLSGCCNEELIDSFELSDYEKSLIPFNDYQELNYIDEKGENIIATTQPRVVSKDKLERGAESCDYWESESVNNYINFIEIGFSFKLQINTFEDTTIFEIKYVIPDSDNSGNEYFDNLINPSREQETNIKLHGFDFENVFVFNNSNLNENSKIDLILYSSKGKGIELISYKDGKYLKLE